MTATVPIDEAGRIVLPRDIRRRLNLTAGSRLRIEIVAERIELTPEPEDASELSLSTSKRAVLKPGGAPTDASAATRSERDAQARRHPRK